MKAYFQGHALYNVIGTVSHMWLQSGECTYYIQFERSEALSLLRLDRYSPAYMPWELNPDNYEPADAQAIREVVSMINEHAEAIRHAASIDELWDYDLYSAGQANGLASLSHQ